jgi:polysaccharide pyruvyl transferase WcaK-like protein
MDAQGSKQAEVSATRILLTGTYCSVNKGDACMQAVFVSEFQRYQRGSLITIASPFPERDVAYYAPTPVIKSRRRNLLLATFHWVMLEFLSALGIRLSRYPLSEEIDGMIHADAVVDLSGDMLTEDYGPLVGYSHFLPLMQAQALGRPVIICAQSVGPFHRLTPLARRILSRAKLITVRDQVSVGLLERLQHSGN